MTLAGSAVVLFVYACAFCGRGDFWTAALALFFATCAAFGSAR